MIVKPRFKPFFLARQREEHDTPWLRVEDLPDLDYDRPLVLVNGVFDLMHCGHMRLLFAAREKAKTLVVAIDGDELVKQKKGLGRPILSWIERAAQMNYMPVDYVVEIPSDEDLKQTIRVLRPDLRVCGMDRRGEKSRFKIPRMFVREGAIHTSTIIDRIKQRIEDGRID